MAVIGAPGSSHYIGSAANTQGECDFHLLTIKGARFPGGIAFWAIAWF